jgi:aminoglycoside 3-N-acetyltransferase
VKVFGPRAEEITRDHLSYRTIGIGSPIDRFAQIGGKVLLMGVGHTANSTVHIAEEYAGTPKAAWRDPPRTIMAPMPDGTLRLVQMDTSTSCSLGFGAAEYALRRHDAIRDWTWYGALLQIMRADDIIRFVGELIEDKPDVLLCTRTTCRPCTGARQNLRDMGKL